MFWGSNFKNELTAPIISHSFYRNTLRMHVMHCLIHTSWYYVTTPNNHNDSRAIKRLVSQQKTAINAISSTNSFYQENMVLLPLFDAG